jgi:hypothetical protein
LSEFGVKIGHGSQDSPPSPPSKVGLVALVALYFTAIAAYIAILALVNVDFSTHTLSQMMIGLFVLVGAVGVAVIYLAASAR